MIGFTIDNTGQLSALDALTTYYLEMLALDQLNEKKDARGMTVTEAELDAFPLNRFLYQYIGGPWQWRDKLVWTDAQWQCYVDNPELRTWVGYVQGSIAGYFELNACANGDTEIAYFGLAPGFIGQGYGGYFLSQTLRQAWAIPTTRRVWVHTCTLDHASALANYQARGMTVYKTETD